MEGSEIISAGLLKGSLLSVTVGNIPSIQMGFEAMIVKKLHSFFVAADAACSKGDLLLAARLAAVPGLATTAVPAVFTAYKGLIILRVVPAQY